MKQILFLAFIIAFLSSKGQTVEWGRFGLGGVYSQANSIATDNFQNCYIAGQYGYPRSNGGCFLFKYNVKGDLIWKKTFPVNSSYIT